MASIDVNKTYFPEIYFTKEDVAELEKARTMPVVFDEDCPETTPERAIKFRRVNPPRDRQVMN